MYSEHKHRANENMTGQKMVLSPCYCNNATEADFFYSVNFVSPALGIRIRMFLGLPDPEVIGTDPDPSIIKKNGKKNLCSYYFVTSL
jgi:hypothetical protein